MFRLENKKNNVQLRIIFNYALSSFGFPGAQYQILAPAYYDQNGQLVMGNPRGLAGTPMRLVSPAPLLVSAGNQQGKSGHAAILNSVLPVLVSICISITLTSLQ